MRKNLLKPEWANLDSYDLQDILRNRVGGPGQLSGERGDNRLYLPLAGKTSRLALSFKGNRISAVEQGVDFDTDEWSRISATIHTLLNSPPDKIGRNIAFSGKRVTGWWRGAKSGVQILPPPVGAPTAPAEMAEHPFILEFPLRSDSEWPVTNARRLREHRKLVLLLNVLLTAHVNCESRQTEHVWACIDLDGNQFRSVWLQRSYFANFGEVFADSLSAPVGKPLDVMAPDAYYSSRGHDGNPLRVPSDLDESICRYRELGSADRERFDRALYWLYVASRQWTMSMSSSFASLVSAIESLTERGSIHRLYCGECGIEREHDVPGPTALFRNFFETYAPGSSLRKRRDKMYALRSGILHGNQLISCDEGFAFGWTPPWEEQRELHNELWSITRIALRNFLVNSRTSQIGVVGDDVPVALFTP